MVVKNTWQRILPGRIKNRTSPTGAGKKNVQGTSGGNTEEGSDSPLVIHGDSWPFVEGLCHLGKAGLPGRQIYASHTVAGLFMLLSEHPDAALVMCLRPREHLFLFYALSDYLRHSPATVVCDALYLTDYIVMEMWNCVPVCAPPRHLFPEEEGIPEEGERFLMSLVTRRQGVSRAAPLSGIFHDGNHFVETMSQFLQEYIARKGVSVFQRRILEALLEGKSASVIAADMETSQGRIENHKTMVFSRLGVPCFPHALLYGMKYHLSLQRDLFTESNMLRIRADKEVISGPQSLQNGM
ncbi:hypothetical protein B5B13_21980 [Salmonella enterica]|nr:hypothetical protein [Salmonella enterica]